MSAPMTDTTRAAAGTTDATLDVHGLRKTFGDRVAVDDVGFSVAAGETYGLLGPNGAGKSTTISIIAGLSEPDAGQVHVAGTRIRPASVHGKAAIGLVPQEIAVYPDMTAVENLRFFAALQGLTGSDASRRVDEVLEMTGLSERRAERVDAYSGGMQRRLNIGIGLIHQPQLLILDEPTVGVDPQSRHSILESIENLATEGMAVLYTTHYMEEAERLCDRIGIIDEGRLLVEGTTGELVASIPDRDRLVFGVRGTLDGVADAISALPGVADVVVLAGEVTVTVDAAAARLAPVSAALVMAGADIDGVELDRPDLEAVFLHLTGKGLRD